VINTVTLFELIRFTPIIVVLIIAAYQDLKTGEVSNKTWLYAPIGLALTIIQFLTAPNITIFVWMTLGIALSLILFYAGGFGGADTKALIVIALSTPATPNNIPIVLTVLSIAAIAALPQTIIKKQVTLRYLPYLLIGQVGSLLF
jgi:Flp pilus assembly protein protease CpaA